MRNITILTCLGHLGQSDTSRNNPPCAASKAGIFAANFANVKTALLNKHKTQISIEYRTIFIS